jgi:hypothetical protein
MGMPATLSIPPERAWQMVLGQLQMEMSKANFDTWVKSIEFVSLADGSFTLGTYNAYGRDWLDSRLKTTVQRLLQGILGQEVSVQFIVLDEAFEPVGNENEELQGPDGEKEAFYLQVLHQSVRTALIEPERVVKLPVYFLRWLPYVNAETLFLVLALRQEYYIQTGGKGNTSGKVAARAERVCQWAGISRAQFFRLMQQDSGFDWFGKKSETDYEVDRRTGRMKKSPNKYTLYGIPITPGDAEDLKQYLIEHGIRENPRVALISALSAQPRDILKYPVRPPAEEENAVIPRKFSVQDVVREAAGQKLTAELMDLTDRLSDHLLTPNEFILVTWYFLRYWLPLLGADAAMLIFILRNACYFNEATGEMRDEVWIEGGYDMLAQRLGLDNPRLISHWFPAAIERGRHKENLTSSTQKEVDRRAQFQDRMGAFAQRIDHRAGENGTYSWKFKVQRADPLIPEHEMVFQQVARLVSDLDQEGLLDEMMDRVETVTNDCFETVENHATIVLRRSKFFNDCSETLTIHLNDCLETLKFDGDDCFETLLKILKGFKDSFFEKDSSSNQDSSPAAQADPIQQVVAEVSNAEKGWNFERLLSRASEKQRFLLAKQEKGAVPFVSWLIHGAANPRIQNPYSLAIAKLVETPRTGAGGASNRLSALPPERLITLLRQRMSLAQSTNKDWESVMGSASLDRVRLLADTLNIPLDLLEVGR